MCRPIVFLVTLADEDRIFAKSSEALRGSLRRYFAARGMPPADIDDLVQEVYLRIVRRGNPDDIDDLVPYCFATAASVLRDRHRRRGVRNADAHVTFDPELHGGEAVEPERVLLGRQALQATTRALMELPERTRQVFILRRVEGQRHSEIATRLGISVSAVEKHMLRAVRHLLTQRDAIT